MQGFDGAIVVGRRNLVDSPTEVIGDEDVAASIHRQAADVVKGEPVG